MARLVIAAAGAAVGFAVTGSIQGAQIGWSLGGVLGASFGPKQRSAGPRLDDRRVTGADFGTPIPYVVGSGRPAGSIAYSSQKRETATTTEQGKGGGGAEYTTYTYDVDLLIVLSENVIPGVAQVYVNGDLIFDGAVLREGVWDDLRVYTGDDSQDPDPTYEAAVGVDNALAYTRRGTVFIQSLKLGTSGQIPNLTFVIGESGATDAITVLLTNVEGASTEDQSSYAHGAASISGDVVVTEGQISANFDNGLAQVDFFDPDYAEATSMGCITYEFLFTPNSAVAQYTPIGNILPGVSNQSWKLEYSAQVFLISLPQIGGVSSPSYWSITQALNGVKTHVAYQLYDDATMSVYCNGNRILNRVVSGVSGPSNSSAGIILGGSFPGSQAGKDVIYHGARIARTEVYTGATYTQPDSFTSLDTAIPGALVTAPLDDVVSNLMLRAGYESSEFDVTDLASVTRPVRSLVLSQIATTASALEVLSSGYFFEYYAGDKIYFVERGGAAAATIPYDSLRVNTSRESDDEPFPLVIGNELELPARIFLSYANTLNDFQRGMEQSDRLISSQQSDNPVELPLGFEPDEAKKIANVMLLDQVAELPRATISLGIEYSELRPTDVINVTARDGNVYRMRIVTRKDTGGVFECELVGDDSTVLLDVGGTDNNYTPQTVLQIAATEWVLIDGPIGQDQDDNAGYYVAAKPGPGDLWPGAVLVESYDGANFVQGATISAKSVFGVCTSTLPNFTDGVVFDELSYLDVDVSSGELSSSTRSAMLADYTVNGAAIGSPDNGWEYVQFRTATMSAPGVYRLSGFLRGRRGTEQFKGTHVAAEYFVLLDAATIRRPININSEIGLSRSVKVVTTGLPLASVTAETFTNTAVGLKPFAPANPTALQDGTDMVIDAQRRTRRRARYGGIPGTSVPLGEATEAYRIRVYDGATLKRTINTTSLPYTYPAADLATDGFTTGETVTFTIAQVSEIVGDGYLSTFTGLAP